MGWGHPVLASPLGHIPHLVLGPTSSPLSLMPRMKMETESSDWTKGGVSAGTLYLSDGMSHCLSSLPALSFSLPFTHSLTHSYTQHSFSSLTSTPYLSSLLLSHYHSNAYCTARPSNYPQVTLETDNANSNFLDSAQHLLRYMLCQEIHFPALTCYSKL